MPRDARETRERLLRAAERLFATQGVWHAQTREIVRAAGQANDSAVQYHFGSRMGLLRAILARHVAAMEPARAETLASLRSETSLAEIVSAIVAPTAARLDFPSGRDFLRITAQLAGMAAIGSQDVPEPIRGTNLSRQLEALADILSENLNQGFVIERIAVAIGMLTSRLAERARQIEDGDPAGLVANEWEQNLISMIVAALDAPLSQPIAGAGFPVSARDFNAS